MKKEYTEPKAELVLLNPVDVIRTSGPAVEPNSGKIAGRGDKLK